MTFSVRNIGLIFLYIVGIILVYPIVLYLLQDYKSIYSHLPLLPLHGYIQVFFSGPGLIILGAILFFAFRHRISGICSAVIGASWLATLLHEVLTKN